MKKLELMFLILMLQGFSAQASALPIITLNPHSTTVSQGGNLFVDVNVSGLQSSGTNSLLGAFSLDVVFTPELQFLPSANGTTTFGNSLGDVNLGEADVGAVPWVPGSGIFSFYEVSLLEGTLANCIFCTGPYLESLQGDSFRLATLAFYLPYNTLPSGAPISLSTANVVLSDGFGDSLATGVNPGVTVSVSEPWPISLFIFGLALLGYEIKKPRVKASTQGKYPLVQRAFRWIGLLAISIYLSVSSITSYAASDVKLLLDDWMDNRWSGETPQALIEAINAAGLDISDVEKMLLNGRSQYPDPSDILGTIITGKIIYAEHGKLSRDLGNDKYEELDYPIEYVIYVPTSYNKTVPTSVIIYGHGGQTCSSLSTGRSNAIYAMTLWKAYAERSGSILIAPLTDRGWGKIGYSILFSVLSQVQRNYNVDPNHIYLTGHSNGGHLAYRSGIYFGDRWAAISPMSGGSDYVTTGLVENLFNIRGFATWGESLDNPYGEFPSIREANRKIRDWMVDHGYLWKNWERAGGGHNIFYEYLDDVANLFTSTKRSLYPKEVFGVAGPQDAPPGGLSLPNLQIDAVLDGLPYGNLGPDWMENDYGNCGDRFIWNSGRPILASTFSWLELKPLDDASAVQRVWGVNKGGNVLEITSENARQLRVYLHPYMVDFNKPVVIKVNGEIVHNALVVPNLATMLDLVRKYDDRGRIFYAAVDVYITSDVKPRSPIGAHIQDLVGDKDDFVPGDVADVPVQSARVAQMIQNLLATGGYASSVPLDVEAIDQLVGWTHRFVLPSNALITSATIKLHLKGNNSLVSNDELLFEQTTLDTPFQPFIALQDFNKGIWPTAGQPFELTINLAKTPVRTICPECAAGTNLNPFITSGEKKNGEYRNLLPLLFDGQFDLTLGDDATVDYSELQITYVLPSTTPGDLDGNSVIDKNDMEILTQALNTPAYTDRSDPRDLDNDGKITVLDGRKLALLCTKAKCAL